jgi:ribosome biogenesis GTPase A
VVACGVLVARRVSALAASLRVHLNDARRGERIRSGVSVAIVGPPNAGKSTLLNTLAQRYVGRRSCRAVLGSAVPGSAVLHV